MPVADPHRPVHYGPYPEWTWPAVFIGLAVLAGCSQKEDEQYLNSEDLRQFLQGQSQQSQHLSEKLDDHLGKEQTIEELRAKLQAAEKEILVLKQQLQEERSRQPLTPPQEWPGIQRR